ncbi:MAG: hypothetical protein WBF87_01930 [Mesorhizobium sp.]
MASDALLKIKKPKAPEKRLRIPRTYTSKQFGDAAEMLVAAELILAGVPALKVPDLWPGYDVIAQPIGLQPQRISVKARALRTGNFVSYFAHDEFDWLAVVIIADDTLERSIYVIPRDVADEKVSRDRPGSKMEHQRYVEPAHMERRFAEYRNNFRLERQRSTAIGC